MRPYCRQHHGSDGCSRPSNRGFRPPVEYQGLNDPNYIVYLRQRADHYSDWLAALSIQPPMPLTSYAGMHTSPDTFPRPSHASQRNITPSTSSHHSRRRDPTQERSKHPFYAVHNGLEGDEIYTTWRAAAPHCWDSTSNYFFQDCICKGFSSYDDAADWLLNLQEQRSPSPNFPPEQPTEPPIPSHPPAPAPPTAAPDGIPPPPPTTDAPSLSDGDIEKFLSDQWMKKVIPSHVSIKTDATNTTGTNDESHNMPFLTSTSTKNFTSLFRKIFRRYPRIPLQIKTFFRTSLHPKLP